MAQSGGSGRDIRQRISLDGGDEVKRQLVEMGAAGEAAVQRIDRAVNGSAIGQRLQSFVGGLRAGITGALTPARESVSALREQTVRLGEALSRVGENIFPHFSEAAVFATGGAVLGLIAMVKGAANVASEVGIMSARLGISAKDFQNFTKAASTAGVEANTFANGLLQLSRAIQTAKDEQTNSLDQLAIKLYGATTNTGVQVVGIAKDTKGKLVSVASDAVADITRVAQLLQTKLAAAGINKPLQQIINDIQQARAATGEAGESVRNLLRPLNVASKPLTLGEALGIDQIQQQVSALTRLGISVLDPLTGKARGTGEVLLDLADAFKKLPDGPEKTATALQIFSQDGDRLIAFLDHGRAGILELANAFQKMGLNVDDANVAIGLKFKASVIALENAIGGLRTIIGLAFAPQLTELVDAITAALIANAGEIRQWAAELADTAAPIVRDFANVLKGGSANTDFLKGLISALDTVRAIGSGIATVFTALLAPIKLVVDGINAVFGTNFSAGAIAAVAILGQITGLWTALGAAVGVVDALISTFLTGPIAALVAALGPAALIPIVAAVIASFVDWRRALDGLTAATNGYLGYIRAIGQLLSGPLSNAIAALTAVLNGDFLGAWANAKAAVEGVIDAVGRLIGAFKEALGLKARVDNASTSPGGTVDSGIAAPGASELAGGTAVFAGGGGYATGPGTSTSDSIWARISNGEFVQKAAAVRHYGVNFMRSVNSMQFPRFAFGGMWEPSAARYATGGLVGALPASATGGTRGMVSAIFQLNNREFEFWSKPSVVDSLAAASRDAQVRAMGRRPTWYGGKFVDN